MSETEPLADVLAEARRLVDVAEERGVGLRLLGGTAIHLRAGERLAPELRRAPKDIDVAVSQGSGRDVAALMTGRGYLPDEQFNLLEGARRMLFHDPANGRQVDVFVHEFAMCHRIPLDERLLLEQMTIPLAELMLTKLQIVQLNAKDELDVFAMFAAHEVAAGDGATINAVRIGELCARDWGLYKTVMLNLERLGCRLDELQLRGDDGQRIGAGLAQVSEAVGAAPKSRGWRLRARVGERVRWYDEPDEVGAA